MKSKLIIILLLLSFRLFPNEITKKKDFSFFQNKLITLDLLKENKFSEALEKINHLIEIEENNNIELVLEKAFILLVTNKIDDFYDEIGKAENINKNDYRIYILLSYYYKVANISIQEITNYSIANSLYDYKLILKDEMWGENFNNFKWWENSYGFTDNFYSIPDKKFIFPNDFMGKKPPKFFFKNFTFIDDYGSINWQDQINTESIEILNYRLFTIIPWENNQLHFIYIIIYK